MVDWVKVQAALVPIRDYEDLSRRWNEGFSYAFIRRSYNFSMLELADYTQHLLGEDIHHRYDAWCEALIGLFHQLDTAGVTNVLDLVEQADTRELFEGFTARIALPPEDLISVLKYLVYWFIPMKKPIRQLVQADSPLIEVIDRLREAGMRFNLDLLANGLTPDAIRTLAESTGALEPQVTELVNRADFSRMPWASAATVSNIVGAGYGSIASLAAADLEQVSADFFKYGESIGKNLKFGNEIESSHRIAKIVPRVLNL